MRFLTKCGALLGCMLAIGVVWAVPEPLIRPPRGWSSQGVFDCAMDCSAGMDTCLSEDLMRNMADILAQPDFAQTGFNWLLLGDCWSNNNRNMHGKLEANDTRFPGGIKAVADYAHSRGLKLALYMDMGPRSAHNMPGLHGHIAEDVKTLTSWGVDMLYVDTQTATNCHINADFEDLGHEIRARSPHLKIACTWPEFLIQHGRKPNMDAIRRVCDVVRSTKAMTTSSDWNDVLRTSSYYAENTNNVTHVSAADTHHWNDMGMLLTGQGNLGIKQWQAQMAIWSIYNSAMFVSHDLDRMSAEVKRSMLLTDVMNADDDTLDRQPSHSVQDTHLHVWHRYASSGDNIVLLVNIGTDTAVIFSSALSQIGVTMYPAYYVRDVVNDVSHGQIYVTNAVNVRVAPSSAVMLWCFSQH